MKHGWHVYRKIQVCVHDNRRLFHLNNEGRVMNIFAGTPPENSPFIHCHINEASPPTLENICCRHMPILFKGIALNNTKVKE